MPNHHITVRDGLYTSTPADVSKAYHIRFTTSNELCMVVYRINEARRC